MAVKKTAKSTGDKKATSRPRPTAPRAQSPPPPLPPRQTREREVVVCIPCHRKKRKCDKGLPCKKCIDAVQAGSCRYAHEHPKERDAPESTRFLRGLLAGAETGLRAVREEGWDSPDVTPAPSPPNDGAPVGRSLRPRRLAAMTARPATRRMVRNRGPTSPPPVHPLPPPNLQRGLPPLLPSTHSRSATISPSTSGSSLLITPTRPNPVLRQYGMTTAPGPGPQYPYFASAPMHPHAQPYPFLPLPPPRYIIPEHDPRNDLPDTRIHYGQVFTGFAPAPTQSPANAEQWRYQVGQTAYSLPEAQDHTFFKVEEEDEGAEFSDWEGL